MALSEDEKREVVSRLEALILQDFHSDFQALYAFAVTVIEKVPEQANNEIRNALNHIARAMCAETFQDATGEITKAKGHFDRGRRDLVKIAIVVLHEQIKSDFVSVKLTEGAVPLPLKLRLSTLEDNAAAARLEEARGNPDIEDQLVETFAGYKTLRDEIERTYGTPNKRLNWLRRQWLIITYAWPAVVGAFILGVLGNKIADLISL